MPKQTATYRLPLISDNFFFYFGFEKPLFKKRENE